MKKPKYFKGAKHKKKEQKEPVVEKSGQKHLSPKAEFPKNSRPIPEAPHKKQFFWQNPFAKLRKVKQLPLWLQVWNVAAIVLLVIICLAINASIHTLQEKNAKRQALLTQLQQWEAVSVSHPGYRDAYIQMAVLGYKLGDKNLAVVSIGKALKLDPNNETALHLEELIAQMGK